MRRFIGSELVRVNSIVVLGVFSVGILQPILPLYLTSLGIIPSILGLMLSTVTFGMVFGEASWGWVTDKLGIKLPMSISTFLCALMLFLFAATSSTLALFFLFFVWGVARSTYFPLGRGYIGSTAPLLKKATFMAVYSALIAATRSIGSLVSGVVVDTLGYDWTFYIAGGAAFLSGLIVIAGLRGNRQVKSDLPDGASLAGGQPSSGQVRRSVVLQCAVAGLQFLEMGILRTFLPLLSTQVVGVTATEVGILFTIGELTTMALLFPMGRLADRKGKRNFMIFGLLLTTSGQLGLAFAGSYSLLIALVIVRSAGIAMFSPTALAMLSDTVPLNRQRSAMGIYGACEDVGAITGSALGGFIWSGWGQRPTFLTAAGATGLGALICLGLPRDRGNRTQG